MAPRGVKRTRHPDDDDDLAVVKKALMGGRSACGVDTVRLAGMCRSSLTVPSAERDSAQARAVEEIGEALSFIKVARMADFNLMKKHVVATLRDASAVEEAAGLHQIASDELSDAQEALKRAKKDQKDGDAPLDKLEAKKHAIERLQETSMAIIVDTAVGANSKELKAVLKLGRDLGLDDSQNSLLSVLRAVAKKPKEARSELDLASLQNVDAAFGKVVEKLAAEIAEGHSGKAARAEAAASAEGVLIEAEQKRAAAMAALQKAKTAERAARLTAPRVRRDYDRALAAKEDIVSALAVFERLKRHEVPENTVHSCDATVHPLLHRPAIREWLESQGADERAKAPRRERAAPFPGFLRFD